LTGGTPAPLILVVGPSGAGKDSLIDGARRALAGDAGFLFVRRVVTRPAVGEDHDTMTADEFDAAEQGGAFILSWRAHGLAYGIPASAQRQRAAGIVAVANASRLAIPEARRHLAPIHIVAVTAPAEILAARIAQRGREDAESARERLRSAAIALPKGPDVTRLDNGGSLESGIAAFVAALRRARDQAT
jgi:ribose 1,5-bisphosphokinase